MNPKETPPDWFLRAIDQHPVSRWALSLGAKIHYLAWDDGAVSKPGLLFVHGMLGHARWWDYIAPFFTSRYRVYALDLSGMGISDHRPEYSRESFVEDIAAVLRDTKTAPATVVGHSFGGARLLDACASIPSLISHAVVLDTRFSATVERMRDNPYKPGRPNRVYPSLVDAVAHYRLMPEQPCPAWLMEHLARHSVRQQAQGWTWSFDSRLRDHPPVHNKPELLHSIELPVSYVYGSKSQLVTSQRAGEIVASLAKGRGPFVMPGAGHHLMLQDTLSFVSLLGSVLSTP